MTAMIEVMATRTRFAHLRRWPLALLAAVLAVVLGVFVAGPASAATTSVAQNGVGASTFAGQVVVGASAGVVAGQQLGIDLPRAGIVVATGVAAETEASVVPRFVASKQGIIDTEAPALQGQIGDVAESMRSTGAPPPGVRQGGLPGKPGVYGNRSGTLPTRPEGYYSESDVWPGTGPRGTERVVTGGPGEVWYTPDHYGAFRSWPW